MGLHDAGKSENKILGIRTDVEIAQNSAGHSNLLTRDRIAGLFCQLLEAKSRAAALP